MILALIVAFFCYIIAQIIISSSNKKGNPLKLPSGNIIIVDTETNGLPVDWKAGLNETNNWPRILSIAWYKISPKGFILSRQYFVIKPDNYTISEEATSINGITNQGAQRIGTTIKDALKLFNTDVVDSTYLVGHNIEFDFAVIHSEYIRSNLKLNNLTNLKQICTMKQSTDYCKIPSSKGYKYPKLSELYSKLFSKSNYCSHNAQVDAEVCMKCFKELYNRNIIKF